MKRFTEIVAAGDHRASLEALRDALAAALEVAEPNVIAQIAGRLQAVLAELAEMTGVTEDSPSDDLARRRADRLSGADASSSPKRRANNRRS